jgi:hypothetical protein
VQEELNGIGFVIFGGCLNILQVFEVNLIDSPIVDTRLIHDYPGLTQKIREKCPKLALQSLMMAIFIYEGMDLRRLQSHHCLLIKLECMMVHAHIMETSNEPTNIMQKSLG